MKPRQIALGFLTIGLLGLTALFVWRSLPERVPNLGVYDALGTISGEEFAGVLGNQGGVVVIVPDSQHDRNPVLSVQLKAFRRALQDRKVSVIAIEGVDLDGFEAMRTGGTLPPDRFTHLRAKYPNATGWALFMGFPVLPEVEWEGLKNGGTRFLVVSAELPGYEELVRRGIVDLAIVPRVVAADDVQPEARSLRESFDQEYRILRAEGEGARTSSRER